MPLSFTVKCSQFAIMNVYVCFNAPYRGQTGALLDFDKNKHINRLMQPLNDLYGIYHLTETGVCLR